jgi:hypothetical protein
MGKYEKAVIFCFVIVGVVGLFLMIVEPLLAYLTGIELGQKVVCSWHLVDGSIRYINVSIAGASILLLAACIAILCQMLSYRYDR